MAVGVNGHGRRRNSQKSVSPLPDLLHKLTVVLTFENFCFQWRLVLEKRGGIQILKYWLAIRFRKQIDCSADFGEFMFPVAVGVGGDGRQVCAHEPLSVV